jgi:hypothetical protein
VDPITLVLVGVCASGAAAALGLRARRRDSLPGDRRSSSVPRAKAAVDARRTTNDDVKVGDVLLYLGDEFWLAGGLSLVREGSPALRVFTAPERGQNRFLAVPRDARTVWVLHSDDELASIGWPGVEVPTGGRMMRRAEYGNAAVTHEGEGFTGWEGLGRYAVFRAHDGVALVVEGPSNQRLALVGREIPRQLIEKMG